MGLVWETPIDLILLSIYLEYYRKNKSTHATLYGSSPYY